MWNDCSDFRGPLYDTGNIFDRCFADVIPSDCPHRWGINSYSWYEGVEYPLHAARFARFSGGPYLYGHENAGRYGIVRYIQGDVWGGTICGVTPPWYLPSPLLTHRKKLTLKIEILRDTNIGERPGSDRIMFAINVWFKSPELLKPLVMDLIFYLGEDDTYGSFEDQYAYHYQYFVGETPYYTWAPWTINLSRHIKRALAFFGIRYAKETLAIYQLEFLLEIVYARAAASIRNFSLTWTC